MDKRVLIVDDEDLIRQGMIARLQYLNLKPVQLYEAESGLRAIEILKNQPVDIVITDIRMADMDGLTLIRTVKSFLPDIHFIIISGYAEFEYAEQAIRLGVTAYLLKPISNEALKKAVEEVADRIDEKKKERQMIQKGIRSMEENRTYLFEKAVNDLLLNQETIGAGTTLETAVFQKFPLLNRYVMVMIIHIDGDSYDHNYFECKDIDLIQFSIKNVYETEALHYTRGLSAKEAAVEFSKQCAMAVIKLGKSGSIGAKDGEVFLSRPYLVKAVDTTGAGDSFNAGFVYGFLKDEDMEQCLRIANACGAMSVTAYGGNTAFPSNEELYHFLKQQEERQED